MLLVVSACSVWAEETKLPVRIRFVTGEWESGWVIDQDAKGIRFKLEDTGDTLFFSWDVIGRADRLKFQQQAVDKEGLPFSEGALRMVQGHEISLGEKGEIIRGLIDKAASTSEQLILKTNTTRMVILRENIKESRQIQMPETEIYSLKELYDIRLEEVRPRSASEHFEIGKYLLEIKYFDKADTHLKRAADLDERYGSKVKKLRQQIQTDMENKDARELYESALERKLRNDFQGAQHYLDAIERRFPDSSYVQKADAIRPVIEAAMDAWLTTQVPAVYFTLMAKAATKQAQKDDFSFSDARSYADSDMHTDILETVARKLDIDVSLAEERFENRRGDMKRQASYGKGSFLSVASENGEDWWVVVSLQDRVDFMVAYFAQENLDLINVRTKACFLCDGVGVVNDNQCPRCQGQKVDRIVFYK